MLVSKFIFSSKRLKTGMPFLKQEPKNDIGMLLSTLPFIAISFFNTIKGDNPYLLIPLFFILLCGILIYSWWKQKLTETYITKLKDREINTLKDEITKLKEYNEVMGKAMHKDNKLIPSLVYELQTALTTVASHVSDEDRQLLLDALARVEKSANERKGILQFSKQQSKTIFQTGSQEIDGVLKFLATKAYSEQTILESMFSANVQMIMPDIISEADLRTLVTDLIENAIIAVRTESKRNILFLTKTVENRFCIEIYDSGAPFAPEVLEKLGKEQITTHKDTGGSGIGYMSTFEILNRCGGTLTIEENLNMENYTKKVCIFFPLDVE